MLTQIQTFNPRAVAGKAGEPRDLRLGSVRVSRSLPWRGRGGWRQPGGKTHLDAEGTGGCQGAAQPAGAGTNAPRNGGAAGRPTAAVLNI